MKWFTDCSGECCVCACGGGCLAGHGDDDFSPATNEQILERLKNGNYPNRGILEKNEKDVLNITRCGECMFSSNINRTCLCSKSGKYMRVNDFCSYGTPKERGGEK